MTNKLDLAKLSSMRRNKKTIPFKIKINTHKAKTELSKLLKEVEEQHANYLICRNGKVIAELIPASEQKTSDYLLQDPELKVISCSKDAFNVTTEEDWPKDLR